VKKQGGTYKACCPFHQEKTPSFVINVQRNRYKCFGCGVSGDALTFIIEYDKIPFVEAVKVLANEVGMPLPEPRKQRSKVKEETSLSEVCQQASLFFKGQINDRINQYLVNRGILDDKILEHFAIGFAPNSYTLLPQYMKTLGYDDDIMVRAGLLARDEATGKTYPRFRNRLMFPIIKKGDTIGFGGRIVDASSPNAPKYLNSPETDIFRKSYVLYGEHNLQYNKPDQPPLVVEGYMDVISTYMYGYTQSVATMGTSLTNHHINQLWRYHHSPVLCFDDDKAGRAAAFRAVQTILPELSSGKGVRILSLRGGEDPDSFMQKNQSFELFSDMINNNSLQIIDFIVKFVIETGNLTSIEGKSKIINDAKQLVRSIKDQEIQALVFDELIHKLRNKLYLRKTHIGNNYTRTNSNYANPPAISMQCSPFIMRLCILLFHEPDTIDELYEDVTEFISGNAYSKYDRENMIAKIINCYEQSSTTSTTKDEVFTPHIKEKITEYQQALNKTADNYSPKAIASEINAIKENLRKLTKRRVF
jgi:DNA primase